MAVLNEAGSTRNKLSATQQQALRRTRELIAAGWCQEAYAVDVGGREVDANDSTAVRFCLLGAIERAVGERPWNWDEGYLVTQEATETLLEEQLGRNYSRPTEGPTLDEWNDQRGRRQAEVLALLDQALAAVP